MINVMLMSHTPLFVAVKAIRTCWDSMDKSDTPDIANKTIDSNIGLKDLELIKRVGVKNKHSSTLEHLSYSFTIDGISRALLQELARHRLASLSVKSTRYTLNELKKEKDFDNLIYLDDKDVKQRLIRANKRIKLSELKTVDFASHDAIANLATASKYIRLIGVKTVDFASYEALANLQEIVKAGISLDKAKYCLPDAYKTSLVYTINARSLRNLLTLRTNKAALKEFQVLAKLLFSSLPEAHKYLFIDCISTD